MKNLPAVSFELSSYFDITPDWVCIARTDGYFQKVNNAVIQQLGYSAEALYSNPIDTFIHPDDRALTSQRRGDLLKGHALLNFVNRYVAFDGTVIWLEWSSIYFAEQDVVFGIAKDITMRRLVEISVEEQFRRLKSYALHVKDSMEQHRKQLAYELHEELAQLIAAVKFDVEMIAARVGDNEGVKDLVVHAEAVCSLAIKTIKRIAFAVSPAMLGDVGLAATLNWLCSECSVLYQVDCYFKGAVDESRLTYEVKIDIFRICQEALIIFADSASLSQLNVWLSDNADGLQLSVEAPGLEIASDRDEFLSAIEHVKGRAGMANGTLSFDYLPNKTGIIQLFLPMMRQ